MYSLVVIAVQQFKVEHAQQLYGQRFEAERGSVVEFEKVLLVDNNGSVVIGAPTVEGAKVTAEVVSHLKGDKIIIFHKKRRKGYRKRNGHRQYLTELKINEVDA